MPIMHNQRQKPQLQLPRIALPVSSMRSPIHPSNPHMLSIKSVNKTVNIYVCVCSAVHSDSGQRAPHHLNRFHSRRCSLKFTQKTVAVSLHLYRELVIFMIIVAQHAITFARRISRRAESIDERMFMFMLKFLDA